MVCWDTSFPWQKLEPCSCLKLCQDCISDFITVRAADFLRPSGSQVSEMLRRFGFVLRWNLVYDFICVNSIFHLLVPQRGYFSLHCSPLFILSCLRPTSRAAVEETAALNSGYSSYASAVHTRSRKMDKTLSVKVFLMSFSTRDSHFYRWDILVPWYFTFFMPHQFFKT